MSELIAEARVLVTPDTTKFGALLETQVLAAASKVVVPVKVVPVAGATSGIAAIGGAASAASAELDAADRISRQFGLTTLSISESAAAAAAALEAEGAAAASAAAGLSRQGVSSAQIARVNEQMAVTAAAFAKAQDSTISPLVASKRAAVALSEAQKLVQVTSQGAAVAQERLSASLVASVTGFHEQAVAATEAAVAQRNLNTNTAHAAAVQSGLARGAGSAALSMVGLRGATLAATGPFLAGAAAAVALGKSVGIAAGFESQLNVLAVTAGATAEQMNQVGDAAKRLGTDITLPGVSASDAAQAMTELSKAGLSVQDSIDGARGVLQLATAAGIDNASATELAANALNAFGLAGNQAVRVADVLANSANDAQGSISDVGLALSQSAAVGRQAGLSLEQTVAALTLFARNGLKASDAGTSFRTLLIRLINPTTKAQKIIDQLGLSLRTATGGINLGVFQQFTDATKNFTQAERDRDLAILFGQDAIRGAAILAREGNDALKEQESRLEKSGTAAAVAGARMQGFSGSIENLKNQLSNLGLQIGDIFKGPLGDFADFLAAGFGNISTGLDFLDKLAGGADKASTSFVDLAVAAGNANRALSRRTSGEISSINTKPSQELLDIVQKTTKALEDSQAPGVAATQMIEGYRDAVASAALQTAGLRDRIDESTDRFAHQAAAAAAVPQGPVAIGPQAKFDRRAALAQAEGSLPAILAVQQEALARAKQALAESHGNVAQRTKLFNAVTQAESDVIATQKRISEDAATKRQQDAAAAVSAQQKADQAVLDSFAPAQHRISLATIQANSTARLSDDVKLQDLIVSTAKREQRIIEDTVKDKKIRNQQLAALAETISRAEAERATLINKIAATATENRKKAADALTASLGKQITLAELRENVPAEVAAINKAIANARARIKNYKKLGLNLQDEKIALEELINKRDDVTKTAKSATEGGLTGGTTLVDLFNEAQKIVQGAGNVGQTATSLQGLGANPRLKVEVQRRLDIVNDPAVARQARQEESTSRLIDAIDRLTGAITGNGTTGGKNAGQNRNVWKGLTEEQRFFYQRQARQMVDHGLTG